MRVITGIQIRMARAALKWTLDDVVREAEIGLSTIKKMESVDGLPDVRVALLDNVEKVLSVALKEKGLCFVGETGIGAIS